MSALATRPRLAAILGMMGSDHDGEVLVAGRAAERIRRQMGTSWGDLLGLEEAGGPDPWQVMIAACRAHPDCLTAWEVQFLATLAAYSRRPSAKQAAALAGIAARVL